MKIALIYFEQKLPLDKAHHTVTHQLLKYWTRFYKKSKTNFQPCLLLDETTTLPNFWEYDYLRLNNTIVPNQKNVLQKVGWMKAQAFQVLGRCIVMDLDAFILRSINELEDLNCDIAMSPDSGTIRRDWIWADDWKEAQIKYNSGVLYMNSDKIWLRFQQLWSEKIKYITVPYYDEIIFSSLLNKDLNGLVLSQTYNNDYINNFNTCKILHFIGPKKTQITKFISKNTI